MSVVDDLRAAADHIEKVGHTQRNYFEPRIKTPLDERPCCMLGAVGATVGYFRDTPGWPGHYEAGGGMAEQMLARQRFDDAYVALSKEVRRLDPNEGSVPQWNDALGRTAEEVVELMRTAADRIEEAGQ